MANGSTSSGSALATGQALVALVVATMSGYAAYQSSVVKDTVALQNTTLEQLKIEISKSAEDRESRKLNNEITLKIFEEVKDVYKTPDQTTDLLLNRLLSVSALIEAVPDTTVRSSLAAAVKAAVDNLSATLKQPSAEISSKAEAVKQQVDVAVFRAEQSDVRNAPLQNPGVTKAVAASSNVENPKWGNYDLDLFWCERGVNPEGAKQSADFVASLKQLDPNASGRWRVRKLPVAVNERPGYQVDGYKIVVTADDEEKIAEVLRAILKERHIPADAEFDIKRVQASSPWYISLFFCPGARS
jgi:hypothetical protein